MSEPSTPLTAALLRALIQQAAAVPDFHNDTHDFDKSGVQMQCIKVTMMFAECQTDGKRSLRSIRAFTAKETEN